MRGLIVNADDFGFSQEINEGVCEAHRNGIVTDASLMIRSPFALQAVEMASRISLPLGLHIDLVTPYSAESGHDLGPNGHLVVELREREYNRQINSLFSTEELLNFHDELVRQIEDFTRLVGYRPSHLDYHFGLHYLPEIMFVYLMVANRYNLPVRWGVQYAGRNPLILAPACLCDKFRGKADGCIEDFIHLLQGSWLGTMELLCHPGYYTPNGFIDSYNLQREYELKILTDPRLKTELERMDIRLVNYLWFQEHGNSN